MKLATALTIVPMALFLALLAPRSDAQFTTLDIGPLGERTEPGAIALTGQPGNGSNGPTYGPTASGGVTVTIDNLDQGGSSVGRIDWRDRGNQAGAPDPLVLLGEDFVKNNAGIVRLTIGGIPAGTYSAVSYHYDPGFTQSNPIEVWLNDDGFTFKDTGAAGDASGGAGGVNAITTLRMEQSAARFQFTSDGVNPVVLVFDGRGAGDTEVPLNGLQWRPFCAGVGLEAIDWVDYPAGPGALPLNGIYSFQQDALDTVQINVSTTDPDTAFGTDPSRRLDGNEMDGWERVNAETGTTALPMLQLSAVNTAGGDLVRFEAEYVFANGLPRGSTFVLARLNYNRSSGERTRIVATAYDQGGSPLPPSVLSPVANYNRVGRSGFDTLAWDLEYDTSSGEFGHIMPGLLSVPSINTDWLELTTTTTISRIVFDVVDCTCVDTDHAFKIAVGKPGGGVRQGKFHGLITNASPDTYRTGSVLIEIDRRKRFSAKFYYNGIVYRFGGAFAAASNDWSGMATSPDGPPITVNMEGGLGPDNVNLAINGTVSGGGGTSAFSALFSPFTATGLDCDLALNGDYTALIAPPDLAPGVLPEGWCYIYGEVQPTGRVALYTRTTDGIVGFAGGYVAGNETFAFHARTGVLQGNNKRTNSIVGPLVFRNLPGISDFDGTVTVYKTSDTTDQTYYPDGYDADSPLIGSRYTPDPGPTSYPGTLIYVDGAATPGLEEFTDLDIAGPTATFSNPVFRRWTYYPATGEISGTYNNSEDGKKRAFGGVFFQKQGNGAGYTQGATIEPTGGTPVVRPFIIDSVGGGT